MTRGVVAPLRGGDAALALVNCATQGSGPGAPGHAARWRAAGPFPIRRVLRTLVLGPLPIPLRPPARALLWIHRGGFERYSGLALRARAAGRPCLDGPRARRGVGVPVGAGGSGGLDVVGLELHQRWMTDALADLAAALTDAPSPQSPPALLVVTGAGVSVASGLPTFRGDDPGAVWANEIMEKGTFAYFRRNPGESWRWYMERFGGMTEAAPNPAHEAIAALERWQVARGGEFLLVTQNIDGLHRAAGSERMVEVHGRADRVRCARDGCEHGAPVGSFARADVDFGPFRRGPSDETVPRCPACGGLIRPHVLWFDEYYDRHRDYGIEAVYRFAKRADVVLFSGTSYSVGVTDGVVRTARMRGARLFSIDPYAKSGQGRVVDIQAAAEVALPELVTRVGAT